MSVSNKIAFAFAAVSAFSALPAFTSVAHAQGAQTTAPATAETRVALVFSGGYDTDPRDRGRPVALVAGALGVAPQTFRDAFSRVHPAPAGSRPEEGQVRENKRVLLEALGPYGITNERLDTVSNYYRYVRSRGEMWPTRRASGYAVIEKGTVARFVLTDGGSGYSSVPSVSLPGYPSVSAKAELAFSKDFEHNGAVSAIILK